LDTDRLLSFWRRLTRNCHFSLSNFFQCFLLHFFLFPLFDLFYKSGVQFVSVSLESRGTGDNPFFQTLRGGFLVLLFRLGVESAFDKRDSVANDTNMGVPNLIAF